MSRGRGTGSDEGRSGGGGGGGGAPQRRSALPPGLVMVRHSSARGLRVDLLPWGLARLLVALRPPRLGGLGGLPGLPLGLPGLLALERPDESGSDDEQVLEVDSKQAFMDDFAALVSY